MRITDEAKGNAALRSLPPKDYQSYPKLDSPAGYICVMRDAERDLYRIEGTDQPAPLVAAVAAEAEGKLGIELISILESEDLSSSESKLFEEHRARPSSAWLEFDAYQLQALQSSSLQINAHSSLYLSPQPPTRARPAPVKERTRYELLASSFLQGSERQKQPEPPAIKQYGRAGLRRNRYQPVPLPVDEDAPEPPKPGTLAHKLWVWTEKHPTVLPNIVTAVVVIIIALLIWFGIQNPATYW